MAISLGPTLPSDSSSRPAPPVPRFSKDTRTGRSRPLRPVRVGGGSGTYLALLRVGFTKHPGHPGPGALLPHLFTLAPRESPRGDSAKGGLLFCGTLRGVAPRPCYGPPCPVESGLSSLPGRGERPSGPLAPHGQGKRTGGRLQEFSICRLSLRHRNFLTVMFPVR